jgi:PBP1b-binding outer membrane lipoprotein LpoB
LKRLIALAGLALVLAGCDSNPPVTRDDAPTTAKDPASMADRKSLAHTKTTIVPLQAGQPGSR